MKKILLIALLFGFNSQAQVLSDRELVELIKRDLSVTTKTLQHEVRGYHWFGSNISDRKISTTDSIFEKHFLDTAQNFWTYASQQDHNIGPGFYAATDPDISKRYGNTMIEVIIPPGTKFIDVRGGVADYQFEISQQTQNALNQICNSGVVVNNQGVFYADILGQKTPFQSFLKQTLTYIEPCYRVFNQAVAELGVEFIAYGWGPHHNMSHHCEPSILSSMVMLGKVKRFKDNTAKLGMGSVKVYGYTQKIGKNPKRKKVDRYRYVDRFTRLVRGTKAKWSYFDNESISSADIANIKNKTFNCQPSTYSADAIPVFSN